MLANSEDPDQTPHNAVSDLDLQSLHMSYKKDAKLIWVKHVQLSCDARCQMLALVLI